MSSLAVRRPVELHSSFTGLDGQVTVTMWRYPAKAVTIRQSAMARSVPDLAKIKDEDDEAKQLFDTFVSLFSYVTAIDFATTDASPEWLLQFEAWWEVSKQWFKDGQYAKMWDALDEVDASRMLVLMIDAFKETRREKLPSAPEVAPGSADNKDASFLGDGDPTSPNSNAG